MTPAYVGYLGRVISPYDYSDSMDHVPGLLIALDNLYLLVSLMPRAAPRQRSKMDGSFVSLITEKARFAEWKKRMGVQRAEDLKALSMKLPADAQRSPATILAPVQEYITLSDQLFEKYGVESANGMKKKWSFRAKLPRVDEFVNGHQGLEDMLAMLKNCNDELSEIVPLVPGRYVSLVGGGHVLVTTNDAQYLKLDTLLQPQPSSSESHSDSPTMNDGCAGTAYQNVIAPTLDSPVEEPTEKVDRPVIQLLHSTCLGVIRSMAVQYLTHQEELNRIGDRLAIWGSGLFRAPVPIDEALLHHPDTRRMKFLRGHIAGILADVTVALRERFPRLFMISYGFYYIVYRIFLLIY